MSHCSQKAMNTKQPESDLYAIPSTSKETRPPIDLPHITTLPSNPQANGMKFLQLSPIKNLPKHELAEIRKNAIPLPNVNLTNVQNAKIPVNPSGQKRTNIKILRQVTHIPMPLPGKMPNIVQQIFKKSIDKNTIANDKESHAAALPLPDSNEHSSVCKSSPSKTKRVPSILKRKRPRTSLEKTATQQTTTNKVKNLTSPIKAANRKKRNLLSNSPKKKCTLSKKKTKKMIDGSSNRDNVVENLPDLNLYIADGFREDVEILLEKCSHVYKLNFEKFTDVWKQINFPRVFHGRQSGAELAEFSEEVIHIAKSHMLAKNVSLEENIAGLFLVYALLNHQPFSSFASLRLVPEDVPLVIRLQTQARLQKRHDVLYILGHVLIKGPCQFHVRAREVGFELPFRKYFDGTIQVSEATESVFTRNAECVQHLTQLVSLEQRGQALRQRIQQRLRDTNNKIDKVRNLCSRPAAKLLALYKEHIPRAPQLTDQKDSAQPAQQSASHSTEVRSIKDKAMRTAVDSMRHLVSVNDRVQDAFSSSEDDDAEPYVNSKSSNKKKLKTSVNAQALQALFSDETSDETETGTETCNYEMPILDDFEDLTTNKQLCKSNEVSVKNYKNVKKADQDNRNTNIDITKSNKNVIKSKTNIMKVETDDSKNNNTKKSTSKRKRKKDDTGVNEDLMKIKTKKKMVLDSVEVENIIEPVTKNKDKVYESHKKSTDKKKTRSKIKKAKERPQDTSQKLNSDQELNRPHLIEIEIERITENIEQNTDCNKVEDGTKKSAKKEKGKKDSLKDKNKDITNSTVGADAKVSESPSKELNITKKSVTDDKTPNKDTEVKSHEDAKETDKSNEIEITLTPHKIKSQKSRKTLNKTDKADDVLSPPEELKSPTRLKGKCNAKNASNPKNKSPCTPKSRRESPRVKVVDESNSPNNIVGGKSPGQNTTSELENDNVSKETKSKQVDALPKNKPVKRGHSRLKSFMKKMGILEVADMSSKEKPEVGSSIHLRSRLKK